MRSDTKRLLNTVQLLSEIGIIVGYLLGLIPFVYAWSCSWVIPLVFVNFVLAFLTGNGTTVKTILNIAMAFLSLIPLIGYVFRFGGLLLSALNIKELNRGRNY
ncbi:hypothetical protein [Paenibacillus roseipurpureus]|uniref:Uncharacterized protein n=1 Tax=Paenibacillus roseopurpureus TaxID=2918901 RepID=A0AA96RKK1_9BACL|nr:hypothetical protein [Paenibacillus sp. MBLB1832]WNR44406.1 hypothetical protein MJB10_25645 [Paenibacillus sp. MBLB1832]